jgi:hypothetical protein
MSSKNSRIFNNFDTILTSHLHIQIFIKTITSYFIPSKKNITSYFMYHEKH